MAAICRRDSDQRCSLANDFVADRLSVGFVVRPNLANHQSERSRTYFGFQLNPRTPPGLETEAFFATHRQLAPVADAGASKTGQGDFD